MSYIFVIIIIRFFIFAWIEILYLLDNFLFSKIADQDSNLDRFIHFLEQFLKLFFILWHIILKVTNGPFDYSALTFQKVELILDITRPFKESDVNRILSLPRNLIVYF